MTTTIDEHVHKKQALPCSFEVDTLSIKVDMIGLTNPHRVYALVSNGETRHPVTNTNPSGFSWTRGDIGDYTDFNLARFISALCSYRNSGNQGEYIANHPSPLRGIIDPATSFIEIAYPLQSRGWIAERLDLARDYLETKRGEIWHPEVRLSYPPTKRAGSALGPELVCFG